MASIRKCILALAALSLLSAASAEQDATEKPIRLELELIDGSLLIGTPRIETVRFQTTYSKMDLQLKYIRTIEIGTDRETASISLRNGDKMKGEISIEPISMETIFGEVLIGVEHTRTLRVMLGGQSWPRDGLWGYWPLNGDGKDASGNGHHGVVKNAKPIEGIAGRAYAFDGRASIELGEPDFRQEEFTIAGWIRTDRTARHEDWRTWIDKLDRSGSSFELYLGDGRDEGGGDGISFAVWNNRRETVVNMVTPTINLRDGKWHHCAATYKNGTQKLFVDGKKAGEDAYSGTLFANATPIAIGGHNFGSYHHPWIGDVDEVFIYERALSDAEVKALYRRNRD
jgi:hypothetical protein